MSGRSRTGLLRRLPPPTDPRVGWIVWAAAFAGTWIVVAATGGHRGVTGVYEAAARHWLGREPLYGPGWRGFLYLPQSAIAYLPFLLPEPGVGSFLWRLLGAGLLATGLFRLAHQQGPGGAPRSFAVLTWLVLPVTLSSLRNGQSNLHLAGVLVHAAVSLDARRPGRAAGWLSLGWLLKPIVLVPLLLAGVHARRAALGLLLGALVVAALPFLTAPPDYVLSQYEAYGPKLDAAGDPDEAVYTNVEGLLRVLGRPLPRPWRRPVQAGAALLTLAGFLAVRRRHPARAGAWLATLATAYLMLFNPRTEPNSYVLVVPWVAWAAAEAWIEGARVRAGCLAALALGLASDNYGLAFHALTTKWWKPTLTLGFLALTLPAALGRARPSRPT